MMAPGRKKKRYWRKEGGETKSCGKEKKAHLPLFGQSFKGRRAARSRRKKGNYANYRPQEKKKKRKGGLPFACHEKRGAF